MTKCVATAVMRNSESLRMSGDTVWNTSASSGLDNKFSTIAPFPSDPRAGKAEIHGLAALRRLRARMSGRCHWQEALRKWLMRRDGERGNLSLAEGLTQIGEFPDV